MMKINRRRGLSLVDVLVAVLLLSLSMSGMLKALAVTKVVEKKSEELVHANHILGLLSESVLNMADNFDAITTVNIAYLANAAYIPSSSVLDNPVIAAPVVSYYLDKNNIPIMTLKKVALRISWTSFDGTSRNQSIEVLVSDPQRDL